MMRGGHPASAATTRFGVYLFEIALNPIESTPRNFDNPPELL
jgi:hypothetical protein